MPAYEADNSREVLTCENYLLAVLITCPRFRRRRSRRTITTVEFFGGFSHNRVDTGGPAMDLRSRATKSTRASTASSLHGRNLSRYAGLKLDVSGHFKREADADLGICVDGTTGGVCFTPRAKASLYNFLGGVQFKDNAKEGRARPFAHLLVGAAHAKVAFDNSACLEALGFACLTDQSETGIAGAVGGGLDIRLGERLDFRAVQLDYNPTHLGSQTQHNFRVGIGVVFH